MIGPYNFLSSLKESIDKKFISKFDLIKDIDTGYVFRRTDD